MVISNSYVKLPEGNPLFGWDIFQEYPGPSNDQ